MAYPLMPKSQVGSCTIREPYDHDCDAPTKEVTHGSDQSDGYFSNLEQRFWCGSVHCGMLDTEVPSTAATSQAAPAPSAVPAASSDPVPALLRSGNGEEEYFNKAIDLFEKQNTGTRHKINRIFVPGGSEYYDEA